MKNDVMYKDIKSFIKYVHELTGVNLTQYQVKKLCKNSELNCTRENEKGKWWILVKDVVSADRYEDLQKENECIKQDIQKLSNYFNDFVKSNFLKT